MTTSKNRSQRLADVSAILATRRDTAQEHAAMHSAQLGIARWSSGNSYIQMELASTLMPTSQVKWHAQAQQDFQAWLQQGGFAGPALQPDSTQASDKLEAQSTDTQQGEPARHVLID